MPGNSFFNRPKRKATRNLLFIGLELSTIIAMKANERDKDLLGSLRNGDGGKGNPIYHRPDKRRDSAEG